MLPLYKQYIYKEDLPLIDLYKQLCKALNENPILFVDQYHAVLDISIFHSIYVSKALKPQDIILVSSKEDADIILSFDILDIKIITIDQTQTIEKIISQIKEN
jgi:hypothetical protein